MVAPVMILLIIGVFNIARAMGDLTSIRTKGITTADPMLIVDTHYRYTPMFFNFVTGPIDFWSSGYWPIRSFDPRPCGRI